MRINPLTMAPTRHNSELKYAQTHGTFPSFFEMDKTASEYSQHIYDYLNQIHPETKAFLLIVRNNTEGPPISVTSSQALFLRRIAELSQPSIIL